MEPEARGAVRNGIPAVPYEYRARTYTWAEANLRRAEQIRRQAARARFRGWLISARQNREETV